jgi:type IV pilus assembly protein PilB
VPAFLIAFTADMIIAQRLVRKVCQECNEKYKLTATDVSELKKQMDIDAIVAKLRQLKVISPKQDLTDVVLSRPKGCRKCNEGYKGRSGIYEIMEVTPAISDLIQKRADATELQKEALKQGMITVLEHGFIKAIRGVTTLEEILRVTQE